MLWWKDSRWLRGATWRLSGGTRRKNSSEEVKNKQVQRRSTVVAIPRDGGAQMLMVTTWQLMKWQNRWSLEWLMRKLGGDMWPRSARVNFFSDIDLSNINGWLSIWGIWFSSQVQPAASIFGIVTLESQGLFFSQKDWIFYRPSAVVVKFLTARD